MVIFVVILIILSASLYIWYPFLRVRKVARQASHRRRDDKTAALEGRKQVVYSAIKEVELDYEMGKLSAEDYKGLRGRYEDEAITLLEEIDVAKGIVPEEEAGEALLCPKCRGPYRPGDRFCPQCGLPLKLSCPACGKGVAAGARFCPLCGAALVQK